MNSKIPPLQGVALCDKGHWERPQRSAEKLWATGRIFVREEGNLIAGLSWRAQRRKTGKNQCWDQQKTTELKEKGGREHVWITEEQRCRFSPGTCTHHFLSTFNLYPPQKKQNKTKDKKKTVKKWIAHIILKRQNNFLYRSCLSPPSCLLCCTIVMDSFCLSWTMTVSILCHHSNKLLMDVVAAPQHRSAHHWHIKRGATWCLLCQIDLFFCVFALKWSAVLTVTVYFSPRWPPGSLTNPRFVSVQCCE